MRILLVTTRKLVAMAALTAAALIMFVIEAQIPLPFPIPGVKLGLANTVTLIALFFGEAKRKESGGPGVPRISLTAVDAFMILTCRIILGAVFTGRFVALLYSIAGGLFAFAAQVIMRRFVTAKQIWVCGVIGAVFHNIGQIAAAMLITGTVLIAAYLPLLLVAGIATGVMTGLAAQVILMRTVWG